MSNEILKYDSSLPIPTRAALFERPSMPFLFAAAIGIAGCSTKSPPPLNDAAIDMGILDAQRPVVDAEEGDAPPLTDAGGGLDWGTPGTDGGTCLPNGALTIAGDYVAPDGRLHWLRRSPTTTTYTIVPGGAPVPTVQPHLNRIHSVCEDHLTFTGIDQTAGRLDWSTIGGALSICVRPAASEDAAAALPPPNKSDLTTGCNGATWLSLTKVQP
jgi:hypothetical protein